jgi:hypothetical protein
MIALLNLIDAIRFRIQNGYWCRHSAWQPWKIADGGRFKFRTCSGCGRWQPA